MTVADLDGLTHTTDASVAVSVTTADVVVDFGFALDLSYPVGQTADGFTIGYWKNNVKKAIDGKTKGVQVDAATLLSYVSSISVFALEPLNVNSLQGAYDVLSAKGSGAVRLLSKQLMGSEFNLMNGAFIGGNELYTSLFLYYGEYLLKYSGDYSASELLELKDLYDAYNNQSWRSN